MEYLYFFANASLTLEAIDYLIKRDHLPLDYVTVVHSPEGWLIRMKFDGCIEPKLEADFLAVMNEFGHPYEASMPMVIALEGIDTGQTTEEILHRHLISVIAHGKPDRKNIEVFQQEFVQGASICPKSLK